MLNVSTGAPGNPFGILLTVHIGVSRGPQTLCPLCFDGQNIKSLHGAYNRHLQMVGQPAVPSHAADNRTCGLLLHLRQGFNLGYIGPKLTCFQDPLESSALKKQMIGTSLCQEMNFEQWQLDRFYKWSLLPCAATSTRTWCEPTCLSFSTTGMYAG